jgi:hypothetical protein
VDAVKVSQRLHEGDAAWFALGVKGGLLRIGAHAYLYTADPHQTTAWLVEGGAVAWPCWEYLPHAAAYVELISVVLDRDGADTTGTRRLGAARFEQAVRREITHSGGQKPCLRLVRAVFAALSDPVGVMTQRCTTTASTPPASPT